MRLLLPLLHLKEEPSLRSSITKTIDIRRIWISLLSRTQPRDYYDLWYLSEIEGFNFQDICSAFCEKSKFKGLDPSTLKEKLDSKIETFESRWTTSMKDQIADLPPFEQVNRELGKHFKALFGGISALR